MLSLADFNNILWVWITFREIIFLFCVLTPFFMLPACDDIFQKCYQGRNWEAPPPLWAI